MGNGSKRLLVQWVKIIFSCSQSLGLKSLLNIYHVKDEKAYICVWQNTINTTQRCWCSKFMLSVGINCVWIRGHIFIVFLLEGSCLPFLPPMRQLVIHFHLLLRMLVFLFDREPKFVHNQALFSLLISCLMLYYTNLIIKIVYFFNHHLKKLMCFKGLNSMLDLKFDFTWLHIFNNK